VNDHDATALFAQWARTGLIVRTFTSGGRRYVGVSYMLIAAPRRLVPDGVVGLDPQWQDRRGRVTPAVARILDGRKRFVRERSFGVAVYAWNPKRGTPCVVFDSSVWVQRRFVRDVERVFGADVRWQRGGPLDSVRAIDAAGRTVAVVMPMVVPPSVMGKRRAA
jgi:hypothetical protein